MVSKDKELRTALNDLKECSVFEAREVAFKAMEVAISRIESLQERVSNLEGAVA